MRLSLSGISRIGDELRPPSRAHVGGLLTIYAYHAVVQTPLEVYDWCFIDARSFRRQVRYLKRHFEVVSLSEAVERLSNGQIGRPTAVITFDDGFQNNYEVAFPILRELGLPATVFLITGLVNTADTVWFCRLHRALSVTRKASLEWDGTHFDLTGPLARAATCAEAQARLKRLPHPRLLDKVRRIIVELGDDPDHPITASSPYRMLGREAILEMARSGLVEFGAHGVSHAILSLLPSEERYHEIKRSSKAVRELTGRPCQLFAYPNGQALDYDAESIKILKACGVRAAVTAIAGPNETKTPVMELKRCGIGANLSMTDFKRIVR